MLYLKVLLQSINKILLSLNSNKLADTLHESRKEFYEYSTWLIFVIKWGCVFCEVDPVAQHCFVIDNDCVLCEVGVEVQEMFEYR
jgi:hypothetical protein